MILLLYTLFIIRFTFFSFARIAWTHVLHSLCRRASAAATLDQEDFSTDERTIYGIVRRRLCTFVRCE